MIDHNLLPTEGPGREDMLTLYSWTLDDAWKAQEEWRSQYGPDVVGRGPFFRWHGAQELKEVYELHKSGHQKALIEAIHLCAINSLPLPRWCEYGFLKAYRKVRQYKARSWDDVFGKPHKKSTNLVAKEKEWEKGFLVYWRIKEIKEKNPELPIDNELFETVGKDFGVCKTLAAEYYAKEKRRHETWLKTMGK